MLRPKTDGVLLISSGGQFRLEKVAHSERSWLEMYNNQAVQTSRLTRVNSTPEEADVRGPTLISLLVLMAVNLKSCRFL